MPTPPYQFIAIARTIARGFTEQAIGHPEGEALTETARAIWRGIEVLEGMDRCERSGTARSVRSMRSGRRAAGKVRCSPSSPCSRAKARCAWLRVAPLLPIPSAARRGLGSARSGRERQARRSNRKAGLRHGDLHEAPTDAFRRRNPHASIDKLTWRREHFLDEAIRLPS